MPKVLKDLRQKTTFFTGDLVDLSCNCGVVGCPNMNFKAKLLALYPSLDRILIVNYMQEKDCVSPRLLGMAFYEEEDKTTGADGAVL